MNTKEERLFLAACRKGDYAKCEDLIKTRGISPNVRDSDNDISWTPLLLAARSCHLETVRVLIRHGADVNARSKMDQTALHAVCWTKHAAKDLTEVVRALLQAGADVNALNRKGQSPLHWAAHYGHVEAVRLLVQYGANTIARNEDGETPLDKAMGRVNAPAESIQEIARIL